MLAVAAASRQARPVSNASRKLQDPPVKADGLSRSGPSPACPDLPADNMPLAIEGVEDLQEPLDHLAQASDFDWDEESEKQHQEHQEHQEHREHQDAERTLSPDP